MYRNNNKIRFMISLLLTLALVVSVSVPAFAASKETRKYKSIPANQGLVKNGSYQDSYKDYEHVVTVNVKKKNTSIKLVEYAGGPYIAEYTLENGRAKKVGKNKKTKYSNSINIFQTYGNDMAVSNVLFHPHTKKLTFKKAGTYTFTVTFRTKAIRFPVGNVYRYIDKKYPKWNFKYDNTRIKSINVNSRPIELN